MDVPARMKEFSPSYKAQMKKSRFLFVYQEDKEGKSKIEVSNAEVVSQGKRLGVDSSIQYLGIDNSSSQGKLGRKVVKKAFGAGT